MKWTKVKSIWYSFSILLLLAYRWPMSRSCASLGWKKPLKSCHACYICHAGRCPSFQHHRFHCVHNPMFRGCYCTKFCTVVTPQQTCISTLAVILLMW
jgi:hypothetical protein